MLCVEFGPKINFSNHPVVFAVVREELVKTITKTVNEASRSFDLRCAAGYFDVNY